MNKYNLNLELLYKATRDGFKTNDLHQKCDNIGPTVCFIKSDQNLVLGGYTNLSWN